MSRLLFLTNQEVTKMLYHFASAVSGSLAVSSVLAAEVGGGGGSSSGKNASDSFKTWNETKIILVEGQVPISFK